MKLPFQKYKAAFGMVDTLVCLAALACIVGLILPMLSRSKCGGSNRIRCISNLKQVAIGFRLYANDGDPYPQFNPTNEAWTYFQVVGKEIGSPKVLVCPLDKQKQPALDFETNGTISNFSFAANRNNALSYFYGANAEEAKPGMLLAGDGNLKLRGSPPTNILVLGV